MPLGVPASNDQRTTSPFPSVTSRKNHECGFVSRTCTILPVMLIGSFKSYAAENEWCACAGASTASGTSIETSTLSVERIASSPYRASPIVQQSPERRKPPRRDVADTGERHAAIGRRAPTTSAPRMRAYTPLPGYLRAGMRAVSPQGCVHGVPGGGVYVRIRGPRTAQTARRPAHRPNRSPARAPLKPLAGPPATGLPPALAVDLAAGFHELRAVGLLEEGAARRAAHSAVLDDGRDGQIRTAESLVVREVLGQHGLRPVIRAGREQIPARHVRRHDVEAAPTPRARSRRVVGPLPTARPAEAGTARVAEIPRRRRIALQRRRPEVGRRRAEMQEARLRPLAHLDAQRLVVVPR